jgi:restriction system protein
MSIPDFQSVMRPLLEHLEDGRERTTQETLEAMAAHFGLTEDERLVLLPSGRQPVFTNRVAWAKSHLKGAGCLESPRRAVYKITDRGRHLLSSQAGRIDMRALQQFAEYQEFRRPGERKDETPQAPAVDEMTPEEHIEYGHQQIRAQLADEMLERVKQCPPEFFERLVVELLIAMGYGGSRADAGRAVGRSGDGGIDGIIKEDRLGLDTIYIQAKRWENVVGRPEIQKFAGALQGQRAHKGIVITTAGFSKGAHEYVASIDSTIVLIDGNQLAAHMIDQGVGVTPVEEYAIQRLDADYFEQDS